METPKNKSFSAHQKQITIVVAAFVVVALLVMLISARLPARALGSLEQRAEARGWGLDATALRVDPRGRLRADEICVSLLDDAHNDICVEALQLRFAPLSAARGVVDIAGVRAGAVRVDSTPERLMTLRGASAEGTDDTPLPEGPAVARTFGVVELERLEVSLDDGKRKAHATLHDLQLDSDSPVWRLEARGDGLRLEGHGALWQRTFDDLLQAPYTIKLQWDAQAHQLQAADLRWEERVDITMPMEPTVRATVPQVEFVAPYTIRLVEPSVHMPDAEIHFDARAISTEVGQWTLHLSDMYLASVHAASPTLTLNSDDPRAALATLRALFRADEADTEADTEVPTAAQVDAANDAPSEDAHEVPQANAPTEADNNEANTTPPPVPGAQSFADRVRAELERRRWWEIAPRAMRVEDGTVVLLQEGEEALALTEVALTYGLRVLQRQMDIELDGTLRHPEGSAGDVDVRLDWEYDRRRARLYWDLQALDLPALAALLPVNGLVVDRGRASTKGRLTFAPARSLTSNVEASLEDLRLTHPRLQEPLEIGAATYQGDGHSEPVEDSIAMVFPDQALTLDGAEAMLSLRFEDFRALSKPHTSQIEVTLEVPDQPAMQIFEAIPRTLRGPVAEARMTGTWGLTLRFLIANQGLGPDGRSRWEIRSPSTYRLRDQGLMLEYLPEPVDVRRLKGAMDFVFRGPNDEIMRNMHVPSPEEVLATRVRASSAAGVTGGGGDPAALQETDPRSVRWVPLEEMSYYLVATQIYREDGSFFQNTGINWLQLRRVLSEALTTGELSRGASTITMQTVKNVFLSHDRSIERKLQELFLSYWLTRAVPKARILEVYLNVIELGPDRLGVQEASLFYFGTPVHDLGIREAVWLSSISPNPRRFGGDKPKGEIPIGSCTRCDRLIRALHGRRWIDTQEQRRALGDDLREAQQRGPSGILDEGAKAALEAPSNGFLEDRTHAAWMPASLAVEPADPDEVPPLFELLGVAGVAPGEALEAVDQLPVDARLRWWIDNAEPHRGVSR